MLQFFFSLSFSVQNSRCWLIFFFSRLNYGVHFRIYIEFPFALLSFIFHNFVYQFRLILISYRHAYTLHVAFGLMLVHCSHERCVFFIFSIFYIFRYVSIKFWLWPLFVSIYDRFGERKKEEDASRPTTRSSFWMSVIIQCYVLGAAPNKTIYAFLFTLAIKRMTNNEKIEKKQHVVLTGMCVRCSLLIAYRRVFLKFFKFTCNTKETFQRAAFSIGRMLGWLAG